MPLIPFLGESAKARSVNVQNLRCLNCFAEVTTHPQSKVVSCIYGAPGLKLFGTVPGIGGIRALFVNNDGRCFVVQGAGFFELFTNGTTYFLGGLLSSAGPVSIATNGNVLMIVDGVNSYSFNRATSVFAQSLSNIGAADRVAFIHGYFLFNRPMSGQFGVTGLYTTAFDPADVAIAEGSPDRLISLISNHEELWLAGSSSMEVWYDSGDVTFPFARIQGSFTETGILACHTLAKMNERVYWLGNDERGDGVVWEAQGYVPTRISTHALEVAIQGYKASGTVSDALAFTTQHEGHFFYWLIFPTASATWVYDATTQLWHERGWLNPTTGQMERHRANCHVNALGKHLVGDWENGNIYELDMNTYQDNGNAMLMDVIFPPLFDGQRLARQKHLRVAFDWETGVGLDGGVVPGTDPQMALSWSDDSGHTWGTEHAHSLGPQGKTRTRVQQWRLGMARDRRYRVRTSAPVKRALLGGYIDLEGAVS